MFENILKIIYFFLIILFLYFVLFTYFSRENINFINKFNTGEIKSEVRDQIDFVVPSIVCCKRSARLCRRVGYSVKGQFAFLFSSSYSV